MKTVEMIIEESRELASASENTKTLRLPINAQKARLVEQKIPRDLFETAFGITAGFGAINVITLMMMIPYYSFEFALLNAGISVVTASSFIIAKRLNAKEKRILASINTMQKENSDAIKDWLEEHYQVKLNEETLRGIATSVTTLVPTPTWTHKFSDTENNFYNMKATKDGRFYLTLAEDDWAEPERLLNKAVKVNAEDRLSLTGLSQDERESVEAIESKLLALSKVANEVNTQKAAEQIREETYKALSLKEKLSHITSNPDNDLIKDNLALLEGKLDELIQREAADYERQISTQLAYLEEGKTVKNSLTLNQSKAE